MNQDSGKITVLVVKPRTVPVVEEIEIGLESYQSVVGGYIEELALDEKTILICNEEGKLNNLPPNRIVNGDIICGTFFLAGCDGGEEFISLSEEQQKEYSEIFDASVIEFSDKTINKTDEYVKSINRYLSGNDFDLKSLSESYESDDKQYAMDVLRQLHRIFIATYGTDCIDELDEQDDAFVFAPAVIQSIDTEKICIGLVYLDTSSSGEHWDTVFITKKGVFSHTSASSGKEELKELQTFLPYRYWYTPTYSGDIHTERNNLPDDIKKMVGYATAEEQEQDFDMQM